jgi:hypothetical protein
MAKVSLEIDANDALENGVELLTLLAFEYPDIDVHLVSAEGRETVPAVPYNPEVHGKWREAINGTR